MIRFKEFIDLQESSTPEKSAGRVSFGRAENRMSRAERIGASAAKRAGFKGGGARHTQDFRKKGGFHSTYPYDKHGNDAKHTNANTKVDVEVNTSPSGRNASFRDAVSAKKETRNREGKNVKRVAPTSKVVSKMKEFRRRVVKSGGQERNPVHQVDLIQRAPNPEKNKLDKNAFKRGRNFSKAIDKIPSELKKAGAKRGDVVVGKPAAMMSGEDPKKGRATREKLYLRKFKSRNAKGTDKTGRVSPGVIGSVQEAKTFEQFILEAKRIKVLRTAHYTSASNKNEIMRSGFKDSPSTGTYHPDDRKGIVYTTPSSRVGNDYGSSRVSMRMVNPKVTKTDSPKGYRSKLKSWMRDASDEDIVSDTNRPTDPRKQSKSAIESGKKIVRVPDAHENPLRKVPKGSYIMLDKEVANKSIDKNPQPTIRAKDKAQRSKTQPKRK